MRFIVHLIWPEASGWFLQDSELTATIFVEFLKSSWVFWPVRRTDVIYTRVILNLGPTSNTPILDAMLSTCLLGNQTASDFD